MLNKLHALYTKLIFENAEDQWIRKITKDNEFLDTYLKPLAAKYQINVCKSRLNTFILEGLRENVLNALKNFKVDSGYWNDTVMGGPFVIYSPCVTFGEYIHEMNRDEGYFGYAASNSIYAMNDLQRVQVEGRWYSLFEEKKGFQFPVRIKAATPNDIAKNIEENFPTENTNQLLLVEFILNCENLCNQVYDQETQFISDFDPDADKTLSDKVNDTESKDVKPTVQTTMPKVVEDRIFKSPKVNSYDSKNNFKKTTKEIK